MFFWWLFFQNKNCWHFKFSMNQIFGKSFIILKNWGIVVYYCWNYRPSNLLHHFIEYRLDQLNNKHTKIAVNLGKTIFWRPLSKEMSAKNLKFFGPCPSTTKWRLCKVIAKLNGNHVLMVNIVKLHEYQTFGLIKMHNMSKTWFANNKFNLLRWNKKHCSCISRAFSCQKLSQTWDSAFNYTGY